MARRAVSNGAMMESASGGSGDRTNTPETRRGPEGDSNVRFFPGVGPVDELIPMGSAARAPVASADDDSNVRVFPGVGPIDELIPMGSAAAVTSTDDERAADESNVRAFPGVGPIDELIPMGKTEKAPVVATMNADAFWGEDSQFLHQAIEAPNAAASRQVARGGHGGELRGQDVPTGSFRGRLLAPVALMFLCLAGVAFAFGEVGLWGRSPAGVPRTGTHHRARGIGRAGESRSRDQTPAHPSVTRRSRSHTTSRDKPSKRAKTETTGAGRQSAARKSRARRPGARNAEAGKATPRKRTAASRTAASGPSSAPVETSPAASTPTTAAPVTPAPATDSSEPVSTGGGSSAATNAPSESGAGTVVSHSSETTSASSVGDTGGSATGSAGASDSGASGSSPSSSDAGGNSAAGSDAGGGARDIGAGQGLPGPGGPPPP